MVTTSRKISEIYIPFSVSGVDGNEFIWEGLVPQFRGI